jgi:EAL domain-containing protein (putative c-di-GMP-specific phosphodiesterase class I)
MSALAEGVENTAQMESLLALGCHAAQGFLFGRPQNAASFAHRWLGTEPPRAGAA